MNKTNAEKRTWRSPSLSSLSVTKTLTGPASKVIEDPNYNFYGPTTS